MSKTVLVKDLFKITIQSFSVGDNPTSEITLILYVDPDIIMQFLAWNNNAAIFTNDEILHCEDWNEIPNDVLLELRQTLFVCYRGFLKSPEQYFNETDKCYVFKSVGSRQMLDGSGYFSLPTPEYLKENKNNLKVYQYPN